MGACTKNCRQAKSVFTRGFVHVSFVMDLRFGVIWGYVVGMEEKMETTMILGGVR